jgi:hypothetical protein
MRSRARVGWVVGVVVLVAGALSACDGSDATGPTATPAATSASSPSAATGAEPSPTGPADPAPGQACEPGSHPDCSDATGIEGDSWRIIAGYADCVAGFGVDEAYGLCTDLDGDDRAGYADAG